MTRRYRHRGGAAALLAALLATAPLGSARAADANRASQAELEGIRGIGPALSQKIVDQRRAAPFADWADFIARVPGVGPEAARRWSQQGLTVAGKPYPAPPAR